MRDNSFRNDVMTWKDFTYAVLSVNCEDKPPATDGFPLQRAMQ